MQASRESLEAERTDLLPLTSDLAAMADAMHRGDLDFACHSRSAHAARAERCRLPAAGQQTANSACDCQSGAKAQAEGTLAPLTPLLPPDLQTLYTAVKRQEAAEWTSRMQACMKAGLMSGSAGKQPQADMHAAQELEKHAGPECAKHVPSHALDASGCRAAYPPELLGIYC